MNFEPGITAIVGPNGCGKSNVADAVRWVLGEQSAKALRGGEMADVIFNGTDSRKPHGMAEVSLTISDVDSDQLKAAGVELVYNEVTLTRRVFRDGGSEYFINKTPCRLKDIQQLFMGTGVGRTSYSIMAQGNITQILSSKPEDRRLVFEEAAGITKFKAQKRESLRKLESTEQNLLRVADLIREVKRQIGSLQRQAGKARRFKQLSQELQHLETQLARHQFDVLQTEIRDRLQRSVALACRIQERETEISAADSSIGTLRGELSDIDAQIAALQQRALELKAEVERHENRVHHHEERLREIDQQQGRAIAEISESEERQTRAAHELESVNERVASLAATLESIRLALKDRQSSVEACDSSLLIVQNELRQLQSRSMASAQQLARVRNEISVLDLQKQVNQAHLEKLGSESIQIGEEIHGLQTRLSDFEKTVEAEKLDAQSKRGTVEERQQRLRTLQHEAAQTSQELDQLLRAQTEKHSRLNVLEQLQESHEGFSAGALAALKQSDLVLGSLADHLRVPDRYVVAIESALGHALQIVLTRRPESARQILQGLAERKIGRAHIAALDLPSQAENAQGVVSPQAPEGAELALSIIEASDSVRPLLQALLGRTLVVSDMEQALQIWPASAGQHDFVALDGQLLSRHGVFTGGYLNGAGNGKAPSSILGRKNQIAELQAQAAALLEKINETSRRKGALSGEHTALQASLNEAQTELRAQEVAIAARQGEFNALQRSLQNLKHRLETVRFESTQLEAQDLEGARKRSGLADQASTFELEERQSLAAVAERTALLEQIRAQRDLAHAALTEIKVQLASEEQSLAALRKQQQPLEQRLRELAQALAQRKADIADFLARYEQSVQEIAASGARVEVLHREREQTSQESSEANSRRETKFSEIHSREASLREWRSQLSSHLQDKSQIEIELAQKRMSVENLSEKVLQKYQIKIEDIRGECITITIADEGPAKVQTLTPEEMASHGVSTDWTAVADQVTVMQKRLEEMGPVNLVAIEEYEETEQRHQFLTSQYDDLVKAKEQWVEVLNRINSQTKEMFVATFNQIRDNFRLMFAEVFGGGKADLHLSDEGDVLESGIEIMARPPGKQLQHIGLLSGGEQTMTAVALLFSIYQVKPSPFCVLDELDAPLDESNINRFVRILKRFLEHSQFIIITHNKRTISTADILYGVTMQEQGVSRMVSVKFQPSTEQGSGRLAASAPSPAPATEDADESSQVVMAK